LAPTPEQQLAGFIGKFTPEIAALIRSARRKMRARLPGAVELVYDNYNFFVIGFGPSERPSEAIFSIAAQAKGVSLCFLQGAGLPDPKGLLRGAGADPGGARASEDADGPEERAPARHQVGIGEAAAAAPSGGQVISHALCYSACPLGRREAPTFGTRSA
jgi:hypothetical protein